MEGLRDKVAIAGVGYTAFAEHWDKDAEDLVVEAVDEACEDAGIDLREVDGIWVGVFYSFTGQAGSVAADPLKFWDKPVTRIENYCASGMDAFRNACIAVAAGVVDIAIACGVEKITDMGTRGLPEAHMSNHPLLGKASPPALFALLAARSFHVHKWTKDDLAAVAVKNHANGAEHSKAHFRHPITQEQAVSAPMIAAPLGRFDCCAVSDGAAAVVVTSPKIADRLRHSDDYVRVKSSVVRLRTTYPMYQASMDFLGFEATRDAAAAAYEEAGIRNPLEEISFAEVHDCFTITELLNTQDLGFCKDGEAPYLLRDGVWAADGQLPVNPSGGLKAFGHPIGATGCRMLVETTKQLQFRADGVQVEDPTLGLAHNLGGPGAVGAVTILGRKDV